MGFEVGPRFKFQLSFAIQANYSISLGLLAFPVKWAPVITVQMNSHSEILLTQYPAQGGKYM